MDLRKCVSLAVLSALLCATPALAEMQSSCATLARNLRMGMSGADVKALQLLLNKNTATKIAETGTGSPGNESEYFGKKTKEAVMRFQNLYKSEVLTPAGLSSGNGFVGALSRAKLNKLCGASAPTASTNQSWKIKVSPLPTPIAMPETLMPDTPAVPQKANVFTPMTITHPWMGDGKYPTPEVAMTSDRLMRPSATFTVYGVGFTGDTPNTLHIGDTYTITNLGVDNMGLINFTVPANVPKGRHYIWVSNAHGVGNKRNFVIVPTPGRDGPTVRVGTPSRGGVGATVTVYGTGFATTWNDIHFPTRIISGVKSVDGKSLTFSVPGLEYAMSAADLKRIPDIVSTYTVVNDYGVSEALPFTVTFN